MVIRLALDYVVATELPKMSYTDLHIAYTP